MRELKRFIPLKPWQGGPPQSISTSPFCGSFCPRELVFSPDITSFNSTLQSSVKTVVPGLFNLNAWAAGSHISMAQCVSAIPGVWENKYIRHNTGAPSGLRSGSGLQLTVFYIHSFKPFPLSFVLLLSAVKDVKHLSYRMKQLFFLSYRTPNIQINQVCDKTHYPHLHVLLISR